MCQTSQIKEKYFAFIKQKPCEILCIPDQSGYSLSETNNYLPHYDVTAATSSTSSTNLTEIAPKIRKIPAVRMA